MPPAPIDVVWDMETGDPDDFLTLLLLLDHPRVNLRAVTITPGAPDQVGLVRRALAWFGRDDLPVGAARPGYPKVCVSAWHYKAYGDVPPDPRADLGADVLASVLDATTTLVTGAALKNLGAAIAKYGDALRIGRIVCQGGFAGEGVVPAERQLAKFRGLVTCPSFNLNGDPKAVFAAIAHPGIAAKRFVSKNVYHGVIYDAAMHAYLAPLVDRRLSLRKIHEGMTTYLDKRPAGKAFHDPLAACCAIDESIGEWAEVELYRKGGEWGSKLAPGSGVSIITGYDHAKFLAVIAG